MRVPSTLNDEVIRVALRRRAEILRKVRSLAKEGIREEVRREWITYKPKPAPRDSLAGVDGGEALREYQGITIYAVSAATIMYRHRGVREWLPETLVVADVDVLLSSPAGGRVGILRETLEAKVGAVATLKDVKLILADGSLRSVIIEPRPRGEGGGYTFDRAAEALKESSGPDIFRRIVEGVEEGIKNPETLREEPLVARREVRLDGVPHDMRVDAVTAAEYVEKLASFRALLREAAWRGARLIYVSKRSRTSHYFKGLREGKVLPPDIMMFQYLTTEPGFSNPVCPEAGERGGVRRIKQVPEVEGLSEFYSRVKVAVSYVRLVPGGPVLRVEIPVLEGSGPTVDESFMRSVMDALASVSAEGYPYPLFEADKVARIPSTTLSIVIQALGLPPLLTGREVLEEWLR